ncbi:hypothetical protein JW960_04835 [candidate division KSB1 bacterium]|nr:hypothetical protein [candidate division KSB1 bacterium]
MYLFETWRRNNTKPMFLAGLLWLIFTQFGYALPPDTVQITPESTEAGQSSIYQIQFSLEQEILPNAAIIVNFPAAFDLSGVLIAGSATINGGFQVTVNGTTVTIKRSGLGKTIKANQKVDVRFANVKNPTTPAASYAVQVQVQNGNNVKIVDKTQAVRIDQKQ